MCLNKKHDSLKDLYERIQKSKRKKLIIVMKDKKTNKKVEEKKPTKSTTSKEDEKKHKEFMSDFFGDSSFKQEWNIKK